MLLEPPDLSADTVLRIVQDSWDPGVVSAGFVPLGAGAHHWVCSGRHRPRWFVTADEVLEPGRLETLLDTYAATRALADGGLTPVLPTVAPAADRVGTRGAVGVVHNAYLVTVTPYLEGESGAGEFADDNQRALVAMALGRLHAEAAPERIRRWVPGPPHRQQLMALLDRLDAPWSAGPFGEATRKVLLDNVAHVESLYHRFDVLAARAMEQAAAWVPTHGETKPSNVLWTLGGPVLVGWESLRLAPRERDLRTVLPDADSAEPLSAYVAAGGTVDIDADMVELFDLEWWLWEVAQYAVRFAAPHPGDADDERFHRALLAELTH